LAGRWLCPHYSDGFDGDLWRLRNTFAYPNGDANGNSDSYCYGNSYGHCHSHGYANCNGNCDCDCAAAGYADAAAAPNTTAAPVRLHVLMRELANRFASSCKAQ
jgi:hypothetical protein